MIRQAIKWSFIAGTAVVVTGVLIGPDRVRDLAATVHDRVAHNVDGMIDTKVKLTGDVRRLQREYPEQIAQLRIQLRDIDRSLDQVEQELAIGEQVMNLCASDLRDLQPQLASASLSSDRSAQALQNRLSHINSTREAYRSRVEMATQERTALESERRRVATELESIEQEAAQFQAQVALLESEIQSLVRNEALVKIAEQRRASEQRRADLRSSTALVRLHDSINQRREALNERLRDLQEKQSSIEYESRARLVIDSRATQSLLFPQPLPTPEAAPSADGKVF